MNGRSEAPLPPIASLSLDAGKERAEDRLEHLLKRAKRLEATGSNKFSTGAKGRSRRFVAIDCEMISTQTDRNALARVAVVDEYGKVLLDMFVRPDSAVLSYRTRWSGISKKALDKAARNGKLCSKTEAVRRVHELAEAHTIVGHAVHNDLKCLGINGLYSSIDTQSLQRFEEMKGLQRLMAHYFNCSIQQGKSGHDPVEDARASMLLFVTFKDEFLRASNKR